MKLDPEAVKRRKDDARRDEQRVEARREHSGNAALAGRELATADAMASKAHIDALAAALRGGGLGGSLRELRVLVYLDLTQGRDPLTRLARPAAGGPGEHNGHRDARHDGGSRDDRDRDGYRDGGDDGDDSDGYRDGDGDGYRDGEDDEGDEDPDGDGNSGGGGGGGPGGGPSGPGAPPGSPAPLPALINLIVPAGTLLGWSAAPGQAGTWGLTDPADTRAIIRAASRHPRTRWCLTLTGPDGTALAHGCARGQHPWTPGTRAGPGRPTGGGGPDQPSGGGGRDGPGTARDGPASPRDHTAHPGPGDRQPPPGPSEHQPPPAAGDHQPSAGPDDHQAAQLNDLLGRLNLTLHPIAKHACDHRHKEDRYTPSRLLGHLIRARSIRCSAPGCGAQACFCDLDHTLPYPAGRTCQCGLASRRHHRCKQAPGWKLRQPQPGIMRWTTPSGRTYTTTPTVYET